MKRLTDWFRSWFASARNNRRISSVERRLDRLDHDRQRAERTIERRAETLAAAEARMKAALETSQSVIRQYDETTNELRAELRVAGLEIEMMGAKHARFLKELDAETAIQARRELGARPLPDDQVMQ